MVSIGKKSCLFFQDLRLFFLVTTAILSLCNPAGATPDYKNQHDKNEEVISSLLDMSLEELAQIKIIVPAAITSLRLPEAPASLTIIGSDDILHTPARNIYDLLEVYVPGAIWVNHEEGPHMGIRGHMANRNYKYLLLVNGRVLNSKAHFGAKSELEQWDLSDINEITIVRGPGSVTYGPGAVAGVINITTHTGQSTTGLKMAAHYFGQYNAKGLNATYGYQSDAFNLYFFGSFTRTKGDDAPHFQVTSDNDAGFVGEDLPGDSQALAYLADYQDDPQIKLHVDLDFHDHWRLWARYTQQGSTWRGNEVKTDFDGELLSQAGLRDRQGTVTLEYNATMSENLHISFMASVDSFDAERRIEKNRFPEPDHALNKKLNFSETEGFLRGVVNWQAKDWFELAVGAEYSIDTYGPGWGDSKNDMRLGDEGNIVSSPDSNAIDPDSKGSADRKGDAHFVENGWTTQTYSIFSEANITLHQRLKCLLSGRLDKNRYSTYLFSPRAALLTEITDGNFLNLVAQRSLRMNTATQQLLAVEHGNEADPEIMDAIELSYSTTLFKSLSLKLTGFYNDAEAIGFSEGPDTTTLVGNLKLFGFEPEISWTSALGKFGINYSYVKQTDWDLALNVQGSGISYGDYNLPINDTGAVLTGLGNDLNNWPNQAIKLFARISLMESLALHIDARLFWDRQGAQDGLNSLRQAIIGQPEEQEVLDALERIKTENVHEIDFRLNASLSYVPCKNMEVQVYCQNLFGTNDNKRYAYDSGISKPAPHKIRYTEEPRSLGIRLAYTF